MAHDLAAEAKHQLFEPFRRLADSIPHVVWITQLHPERVIYVSPSFEQIWGYTPQELYDDPRIWTACIHPDDRAGVEAEFVRWITGTESECRKLEYRVVQRSGALRWITDHGVVAFDEHGKAVRVSGVCTDITELKVAEREHLAHLWFFESLDRVNQAIQGTDELEEMVGDVLAQLLDIVDCDRAWLSPDSQNENSGWRAIERARSAYQGGRDAAAIARGAAALLGAAEGGPGVQLFGEFHARPVPEDPVDPCQVHAAMCSRLLPKAGASYSLGMHHCRGARRWSNEEERLFREVGRRLSDAIGTLWTVRSLRESEARLDAAQRQAHLGYWSVDLKSELVTWSAESFRICGMVPEARPLRLQELVRLLHPSDLQRVADAARRAIRGDGSYVVEHRVVRPSSELRYVHSEGHVVRDSDGLVVGMFGAAQDITERKRAEQLFAAQHAVTKLLAEGGSAEEVAPRILQAICETLFWDLGVLWQYDAHGALCASDVWCAPGVRALELIAATRDAPDSVDGEQLPAARAPWFVSDISVEGGSRRALAAANEGLHAAFGFPVPLGTSAWGVLEFVSQEIRQLDPDLLAAMATLGSQIGQFVERKQAESALQSARDQLARVTRVASLGELTASIAHEVNQPLTGIIANAHAALRWLGQEPPQLPEAVAALQRLARDGKRAGEVVGRLRALVRQGEQVRKTELDVNLVITETLTLIRSELQQSEVMTVLELAAGLPCVFADRVQLQQVVLNLIINAIEAMSGVIGRERRLTIRTIEASPDCVLITVADTGVGVEAQNQTRIFDAFFTTKSQGMGMGLAISRSIVEEHAGRLTVVSETGRGTSFQFTLPKVPPP